MSQVLKSMKRFLAGVSDSGDVLVDLTKLPEELHPVAMKIKDLLIGHGLQLSSVEYEPIQGAPDGSIRPGLRIVLAPESVSFENTMEGARLIRGMRHEVAPNFWIDATDWQDRDIIVIFTPDK